MEQVVRSMLNCNTANAKRKKKISALSFVFIEGKMRKEEQEKAGARNKVCLCLSFSPTLISNDHNVS